MDLMGRIDQHNPQLTKGAKERMGDLQTEWTKRKSEMMQMIEMDLKKFNQLYKEKQIPALILDGKA